MQWADGIWAASPPTLPLCPSSLEPVATWEHIVLPQQAHPSNFDNIRDWWELAEKHVKKKSATRFQWNDHLYYVESIERAQSENFRKHEPNRPAGGGENKGMHRAI